MKRFALPFFLILCLLYSCKKQQGNDSAQYGSWTVNGKRYQALKVVRDTTVSQTITVTLSDESGDDAVHTLYLELPPGANVAGNYSLDAGVAGSIKIHTYTYVSGQQRFQDQYANERRSRRINTAATASISGSPENFSITIPEIWLFNSAGDSVSFAAGITAY